MCLTRPEWAALHRGWAGGEPIPAPLRNPLISRLRPSIRGGPAARAGLRRGDLIDIRANTPCRALLPFRSAAQWTTSHPFGAQRVRCKEELTVIPRAPKLTWNFWLSTFAALWLLLFAALIAWRRCRCTPDATAIAVARDLCSYGRLNRFRGAVGLGVRPPEHLRERSWTVVGGVVGGVRKRLRPAALAASSYRTMAMLHVPRDLHRDLFSWDCRSYHAAVRSRFRSLRGTRG